MKQAAMKIKSVWNEASTFKLMPLNKDVFFNEAIFDPGTKILAVLSKEKYEYFAFLPKLDAQGRYIPITGGKPKANEQIKYQEERRSIERFYEYKLLDRKDIEWFCKEFAGMEPSELDEYYQIPEESKFVERVVSREDAIAMGYEIEPTAKEAKLLVDRADKDLPIKDVIEKYHIDKVNAVTGELAKPNTLSIVKNE